MTNKAVFLTKKGLKNLQKELAKLKRDKQNLDKTLRSMERIDNREVFYVRNERLHQLAAIEAEIAEKTFQLKNAQVLTTSNNPLEVAIGSIVKLFDPASGRTSRYQIVDSLEADPTKGKVSVDSPLGRQLLGKQPNDKVEFSVGLKQRCLEVVQVS